MKEHLIVRDLLTLSAAGALSAAEEHRVQEHVAKCEACRTDLNAWCRIAGALNTLPTPQASPRLVFQTQRLLLHALSSKKRQASQAGLALLVVFSWMIALTTLHFVNMLNIPIAQWLDVSSTTLWFVYVGISWVATALAAGLLGKHWQREGKTI